jgi:rfaE bifunctional protein nucleotidyltransferase chain/domain
MILDIESLGSVRDTNPHAKIVLTSGTFDLFHVGHLNYLNAVKAYGDIVVVLLSGDARVKARKGPTRPVISENERAQILDALNVVDYVIIDPGDASSDQTNQLYADIVARLQPDFYVTDGEDPRFWHLMDQQKLVVLPRATGGAHTSTSAIIKHITRQ